MRVFLPLDASGASCNGQNSANPSVKPCFLRCCVFQTAINICAKTSPKCPTKTSQKRQKSEKRHSGQASKKHLFFQSVLFSKCAWKGLEKGHPPLHFWSHFFGFFGPGWPVSPRPPKMPFAIRIDSYNHENHASVYYLMRFCCIVFVCIHVHAQAFLCICFRLL